MYISTCTIKPFHCQTLIARSCPYVPYDVHKIPENDLKINPELFSFHWELGDKLGCQFFEVSCNFDLSHKRSCFVI